MKKIWTNLGKTMLIAGLTMGLASCDNDEEVNDPGGNNAPQLMTIAEVASNDNNFSILVDALSRTDLVDAVSDVNANLTVFAPTNAAFQDLLTELDLDDLDAVESAIGKDGLKAILLYHVLGMEVKSDMVSTGYVSTMSMNTTNDKLSLFINTMSGVKINDRAMVTTPDVDASNGVIHVIDKVILPMSIYELLMVNPKFSSITTALSVADGNLDDLLNGVNNGPFTLFAPDDMAFGDLLSELSLPDLNALVGALGTDGVSDVLTYHVVSGNVNSDEVPIGMVNTENGGMINIAINSGVMITDARSRTSNVTNIDIQGTNGVIHSIDNVLLP